MSVVGIDFGSSKTVIAVAQRGNVDILVNEVSNRSTPSMVSFGSKNRYLGESAKTQEISNFKNTVSCIKRLIGRKYTDPEILLIEKDYVGAQLVDINGQVGVKVNFLGKEEYFTATQIAAMYFTKIKQTFQKEQTKGIPDVVISVPSWFTDSQRRGILDAAEIAGLNTLRIMNDITAAALSYGITKTDLPEDKSRIVCFIDIGHSNYSVSIVAFKKGQLTVKSSAYDRNFGGRDFDKVLVNHFAKELLDKYKIDINSNAKAKYRMTVAVEKLKKILSANAVAPISLESLMNDVDVNSLISREDMEKLAQCLFNRITFPLREALDSAGMTIADIDSIEMIGGCTRIPSIKEKISSFFGKPLSFTLNQDEAVARGCAFACAILSPIFKVREFSIHDLTLYPIQFSWEASHEVSDEETNLIVFPKNNVVPSTKILTFYRKEPFTIEASYADPSTLPGSFNTWIGRYHIKNVVPDVNNDFSVIKVRARLNLHGLLSLEHAYIVEEQEIEEVVSKEESTDKEPKGEEKVNGVVFPDSMDVEQEKPETRKVKKLVKKKDLTIVSENVSLDIDTLKILKEREEAMILEDKIIANTENQKNALEEYIYDMRSKLYDLYADYASNEEKVGLEKLLNETEEWLYDEGEDTTKAIYKSKLDDLIKFAAPIVQRKFDADEIERIAREEREMAERAQSQKAKKDDSKENNFVSTENNFLEQDTAHIPSVPDTGMKGSV
ncbi:hypothetical protein PNEG_02621 [Pneumocystis murina B123]|uniref:Heat shock protein hsp88 n=1 Tax=Pneumocystis murina (strain B123) TaxID=1069680 RepID=M7PEE8_PNEMU|nr:hypothetical protein PNEG_02621 [Pneumocystis murina B123]EMR08834.1 hypothetical protein PNEG_02621 [Pneumocystis murina B123]